MKLTWEEGPPGVWNAVAENRPIRIEPAQGGFGVNIRVGGTLYDGAKDVETGKRLAETYPAHGWIASKAKLAFKG